MKDASLTCDREEEMRKDGWVPAIAITIWVKEGDEKRAIHYHGPRTITDHAALIQYLTHGIQEEEHERELREANPEDRPGGEE